jgi:ABC-type sugar transport system ATPase subunit
MTSSLLPNAAALPLAIEVSGLCKSFPGVRALDDVALQLNAGEIHGLVGQNGAGKSTLINILSGMFEADRGTIAVGGNSVSIGNARHAYSLGIATVYQELSLLPNLSVEQNLVLGREPTGRGMLNLTAMREAAKMALAALDLNIEPTARVSDLPLAERQMIEIAKALANDPQILILDEPTAPLGQKECEQLFSALDRLKQRGVAILYVSHRFAEVLRLCSVATIMRNGRNVVTAPLAGWTEAGLTDAMIGGQARRYVSNARGAGEDALSAQGLSWGSAVEGVTLHVRRGEIVVLTGLIGAGQNQIARLLGGDLVPERGQILVNKRPMILRTPHDAVRARICLLTEDRAQEGILPNRRLSENIGVASLHNRRMALGIVKVARERKDTSEAASRFGVIASSIDAPTRTLSGGNQQKSLLARWWLADSDVYILIEPTRGVDVGARSDIYRQLDSLARSGKAILLVSSDLSEALAIADRILVVRNGRIHAEKAPSEIDEEDLNLLVQGVAA